jgi:FKBP-type peptidyl-prolyl cis-trans isomerase
LKYRIIRPGSEQRPTVRDTVRCHYKGWLDNGQVFDSSYDRGEAVDFPMSSVIPGWTECSQLIGEGGEIELEIPSQLGDGKSGTGPIPGDATLRFKVELIKVL